MEFLMDSVWGGSLAPAASPGLTEIADTFLGSAPSYAFAGGSAVVPAASPSWFSSIGSAIASPFVQTGKAIAEGLPGFANTAAQGLNNMLISKYLLPQPKNQGNGSTIVYTDRPNQGTTPPSVVVVPGASGGGSTPWLPNFLGGSGDGNTSVVLVMVGALILLAVFLSRR